MRKEIVGTGGILPEPITDDGVSNRERDEIRWNWAVPGLDTAEVARSRGLEPPTLSSAS